MSRRRAPRPRCGSTSAGCAKCSSSSAIPNAPSGRLPAGPHGYLLRVEPDELDMQRFERLVVLAREADAHGDPAAAVPCLTEALDLWRGPALADARDLSATRSEVARLEELRVVAIEELAEVRLALGEHALAVDSLTAAIKEHPLRERFDRDPHACAVSQ